MFDASRDEIVGGSLTRVLLVLAAPLVAQNFALVAQSVVDLFWVGRLGADAVAAVGLATVVVGLLMVPIIGLFTGSQVVTAQRVGAEEIERARRVPFNATYVAVVVSAAIAVLVAVFARGIVATFSPGETVAGLATSYLTVYALALVATGASDTLESGFTGWGDTRAAFAVNVVAIVVNLGLDPVLIFGWGPAPALGVTGAALATAVGYACGALFALWLAVRGRRRFRLTRAALEPDLGTVREVVSVGTPTAAQGSGRHVARLLVVAIVTTVGGAPGLAAYYLGSQVATAAFVPAKGLGQAATSVVGQNLGADHLDRARRTTWLATGIAVGGLAVLGLFQWLFPAAIARLFVPGMSGLALEYSALYLRILAFGYWGLGAIYAIEAGFNGAGRTDVSMYATLLQYWTVRLPVAAVGAFVLLGGVAAVFWAITISNVVAGVGMAAYYRYSASNGMLERAAEGAGASLAD